MAEEYETLCKSDDDRHNSSARSLFERLPILLTPDILRNILCPVYNYKSIMGHIQLKKKERNREQICMYQVLQRQPVLG